MQAPIQFSVRDTTETDEPRLRSLLSESVTSRGVQWSIVPGNDCLAALRAEAEGWTLAVAEDAERTVLGHVSVATRTRSVSGALQRTCYITNFRVRPEYRGRGIGDALCRHAAELCRRAGGDDIPALSAIRTGNPHMRGRPRGPRGLPELAPFARICIHSAPLHRVAAMSRCDGVEVSPATVGDIEEMASFSASLARTRQFAPAFDAAGLLRWIEGASGLAIEDYLIARSSGRVVGWAGFWDDRSIQSVQVAKYTGSAALRRPLQDIRARLTGAIRPPLVGERVGTLRAVHISVPGSRPAVLRALFTEGARRCSHDCRWIRIALDERDPLMGALSGLRRSFATFDAHVTTPGGRYRGPALDDRPLHFEAALA